MPRYVPEDSLQSPRFTGPSTFARLPLRPDARGRRPGGRRRPVRHRRHLPGRRPVRAERRPRGQRHAPAVQREPRRQPVRDPVLRRLRRHRDRARATPSAATRRSRRRSRPIVEAGVVPLLIGGDHACTLPHLRATRSRGPVAVIDFDSHTDAWDSYFGERYNHGTWMRRAIEEGLVDVDHSIEVGLRGSLYDARRLDRPPRPSSASTTSRPRTSCRIGPAATAAAHPRAGRRPAGLHQLRHRRRRSGLRARHRHARAGRPVGPRRAGRSCAA